MPINETDIPPLLLTKWQLDYYQDVANTSGVDAGFLDIPHLDSKAMTHILKYERDATGIIWTLLTPVKVVSNEELGFDPDYNPTTT